jgi:hypothetical protein
MLSDLFNFFKTEEPSKFEDGGATISEPGKSSLHWKELEYFKSIKSDLKEKYGDGFAVIKGNKLIGVWATDSAAESNGLDALGDVEFLIHGINDNLFKPTKLND